MRSLVWEIVMDMPDSSNAELSQEGWTKEYSFLFWDLLVSSGSYDEFVQSQFSLLGYSETHTYSKVLWISLNLLSLVLLLIASLFLILIALLSQGAGLFGLLGLAILAFAFPYGYLFYRLTFVPP